MSGKTELIERIEQAIQEVFDINKEDLTDMMKSITEELEPIEAIGPNEVRDVLLKVLSSQAEEQDVDDLMKALEEKGPIAVKPEKAEEEPVIEPMEELKEDVKDTEGDLAGMRPIVREEDSEEESAEEEGELAAYRKQRLLEKTKEETEGKREQKRRSPERKYGERKQRERREDEEKRYRKREEERKEEKEGVRPPPMPYPPRGYPPYPYYPPPYPYYPPGYPPAGYPPRYPPQPYPYMDPMRRPASLPSDKKPEPESAPAAEQKAPSEPKTPENKVEQKQEQRKTSPKKKRPGNANSVLIKQIPPELNTISTIDSYFKRFGKVVNVSVDTNRKTALVRFASQEGAIAAKASTEPILGNPSIKLVYEMPQEKAPVQASPKVAPAAEPTKRGLREMKKDYEKYKMEFMEKATQRIQELLAKLSQNSSEEEKAQINNTIDLIKEEMKNYSKKEPKAAPPPRKEKVMSPYQARPAAKKHEACLEGITEDLQNYGSLISKLKTIANVDNVKFIDKDKAYVSVRTPADLQKLLSTTVEGFKAVPWESQKS